MAIESFHVTSIGYIYIVFIHKLLEGNKILVYLSKVGKGE